MSENKDYKHIDSWKHSRSSFVKQLNHNKEAFKNGEIERVPMWSNLIYYVKTYSPKRIVDVGCGTGCYYPIVKHLGVEYIGYDYSHHAIDLAKEEWGGDFICRGYQEMTPEDIREGDLVVANALTDVLPNGDECVEHLLSLGANELLIQRIRITEQPNHFKEYEAYDIMTYEFHHNREQLMSTISHYGYRLGKVIQLFNPAENIFDIEIRKPE